MNLTGFEKKWFEKILDSLIPPGVDERYPASASETGGVELFDDMISSLPFFTAIGLRASIYFVEFAGPLAAFKKAGRFSSLGQDGREKCLAELYKSDIYFARQMALLHKSVACMAWGADAKVRAGLGMAAEPKFVERSGEA